MTQASCRATLSCNTPLSPLLVSCFIDRLHHAVSAFQHARLLCNCPQNTCTQADFCCSNHISRHAFVHCLQLLSAALHTHTVLCTNPLDIQCLTVMTSPLPPCTVLPVLPLCLSDTDPAQQPTASQVQASLHKIMRAKGWSDSLTGWDRTDADVPPDSA